MSTTEYDATKTGAPVVTEERHETTEETAVYSTLRTEALGRDDSNGRDENDSGGPTLSPAVGDRAGENSELKPGKRTGLCHHVMESGFYCQSPALRDRRYCYSHLRLRGQRVRMARAIAKRQPYRFDLPALDDLYAVQAAVEHVARALGAGLLERRQAGTLLYALQQSAINHRILALVQMNASSADPPLRIPPSRQKPARRSEGTRGHSGGAPVGR